VSATPANQILPISAGLSALQAGRPEEAERLARLALQQSPLHAGWLALLALGLSQQQRPGDALPCYQQLCELQPLSADHWSNLGNCLCELGREHEALAPLQRALQCAGDGAEMHYALARAWVAHGEPRRALEHVERALKSHPRDPEFQLLRARALVMLDEYAAAGEALDALRSGQLAAPILVESGNLLLQLGLYEDAAACFRAVPEGLPEAIDVSLGLAAVHERCNRLAEAQAIAAQLAGLQAQLNRHQMELWLELEAQLASRRADHALARERLESLLQRPIADAMARGDLWLKLGRCCDELGDAEAAMAALSKGHAERFTQVTTTHAALPHGDGLLAVLDAPVPALRSPLQAAMPGDPVDPVFLVGFPRSGTTLLEQLLDAHPGLASFDEQPFLQRLVSTINQGSPGYPQALTSLDEASCRQLRRDYFAEVQRVLPDLDGRCAVDKNPLNLVRLPLVATLFPQARVLLALRHPCDVVLSCYMQNFRSPAFSITFETLASTARMYARVMAHFHGYAHRLGLPLQVVRYEDLVADVASAGKRLFGFLDLPWSDDLIAFTERARAKGAISTPSYAQVVQPVNQRAVGRWQRYQRWFEGEPLDTLGPWIEQLGYAAD
jgi:tetratricopeptide (TPR) repeat protein